MDINKKKQIEYGMEEVGEDATKYNEFVTSYFAWIPMEKQKDRVKKLEKITKKEEKRENDRKMR